MRRIALALDLGGTNLRIAAVDADGNILHRVAEATVKTSSGDEITGQIIRLANECREHVRLVGDVFALTAAVPATIEQSTGILRQLPNLPALEGASIRDVLSRDLGLDVILENDANAAAYGENWLGASRGVDDSICLTLGTGVGGGLILNGRPFRGKDGTAGEIGHLVVEPEGVSCGCGGRGCLEQYASATALVRMARKNGLDVSTAHELARSAMAGDPRAAAAFDQMGYYLGVALSSLVNLLDPEIVVIGGGVAAAWELFIGPVRQQISERAFRLPAERVKIVRARLADDAGILGAARLAFEQARET